MTRCHGEQEHMRVTFDVLCRQHHVWLPVCVCVCARARAPERARACWTCVCGCVRACVYVCVCIVRTHVCVHTCAHIINITSVDKHTHTERETHTHTDTHTHRAGSFAAMTCSRSTSRKSNTRKMFPLSLAYTSCNVTTCLCGCADISCMRACARECVYHSQTPPLRFVHASWWRSQMLLLAAQRQTAGTRTQVPSGRRGVRRCAGARVRAGVALHAGAARTRGARARYC
jgi:hypothetical protein